MEFFNSKTEGSSPTPPVTSNAAIKSELTPSTPYTVDDQSIWSRLQAELKHNPFYPVEVTGDVLHGPDSFAPTGPLPLFGKTLVTAGCIALLVLGRVDPVDVLDSWANMTLWLSTIYLCSSWLNTVYNSLKTQEPTDITFLQQISWALYAIVGPCEIVVFSVFFAMNLLDEEVHLGDTIKVHALTMVIVLVEGLVINRIPLRALHSVLLDIYTGIYFVLAMIARNQDVIGNHGLETKVTALICFVFGPVSFVAVYAFSLGHRKYSHTLARRYDGSEVSDSYVQV